MKDEKNSEEAEINPVLYRLDLAGFSTDIQVSIQELNQVHRPLINKISSLASSSEDQRYIVFLAGPPGAGKTTVSALWEKLAREEGFVVPFQTFPLDGFHFTNTALDSE